MTQRKILSQHSWTICQTKELDNAFEEDNIIPNLHQFCLNLEVYTIREQKKRLNFRFN